MQTQEEVAYQALKELIVHQALPIGEFLSQRMLAARVGVAVITLRASLRRLEQNGLIENVPKWGVRIPAVTVDNIRDRYYLREVLEVAALGRFHGAISPLRAARLRELALACDIVMGVTSEMINIFARAHTELHRFIAECADSKLLLESLDCLLLKGFMFRNAAYVWSQNWVNSPDHHTRLVETLLDRDIAEATIALRAHIQEGMRGELAMLASQHSAGMAEESRAGTLV